MAALQPALCEPTVFYMIYLYLYFIKSGIYWCAMFLEGSSYEPPLASPRCQ